MLTNKNGRRTERHLPKTDESVVSVAKTYRDETKLNISARSQWPSSAVEYRRLKQNF